LSTRRFPTKILQPRVREVEINIPNIDDTAGIIRRVESVLAAHRLTLRSRGTVKSYPGCTHWHWKNATETGTLEVTLWPARRRLWFKVQAGRRAAWIDQIIPLLKAALERA
jgi:hypothetical protein